MTPADETSWTLIQAAAAGDPSSREIFAGRYLPAVRAYLRARWRGSPLAQEVDDTVQEVFLDCFREGGALGRLERGRGEGFRAFLYGVARLAALRLEERRARDRDRRDADGLEPALLEARETRLSQIFDREWARLVLREAVSLQTARARTIGPEALRRVELLRLRFEEDLPIREIAARWSANPARLHTEYALARREFTRAFLEALGLREGVSADRLQSEAKRLLGLLGADGSHE